VTTATPRNPLPDPEAIEARVQPILELAAAIRIQSNAECREAGDFLLAVKAVMAEVDEEFDPAIKRWHEGHKAELARKARLYQPLATVVARIKNLISGWFAAEEQRAAAEERRAQALADQEALRLRAEEAAALRSIGAEDAAVRVLSSPPPAYYQAPVIHGSSRPVMPGIVPRENWTYEVTNMMALVRAVACGRAPLGCLMVNSAFMGQQARSLKQHLNYPGVEVKADRSLAAGRGRRPPYGR
jgi:hypothetical protein